MKPMRRSGSFVGVVEKPNDIECGSTTPPRARSRRMSFTPRLAATVLLPAREGERGRRRRREVGLEARRNWRRRRPSMGRVEECGFVDLSFGERRVAASSRDQADRLVVVGGTAAGVGFLGVDEEVGA